MSRLFRSTLFILFGCIALYTVAQAQDSSGVRCLARLTATTNTVVIRGNYAYTIDSTGLNVINIDSLTNPHIVSHCNIPGIRQNGFERKIAVTGEFAYIVAGDSGLRIVNVSNPDSIYEVGFFNTLGSALSVATSGNYAYVTSVTGYECRFLIINLANPTSPQLVSLDTLEIVACFTVVGNFAYGTLGAAFTITDISNPLNPHTVGRYTISGWYATIIGVAVIDHYALITCSQMEYPYGSVTATLQIMDVADPSLPVCIGTCQIPENAVNISVVGNYAFLALRASGLQIINVSNPSSPNEIGFYNTPGNTYDVVGIGQLAYLADHTNFGIYDCSQALAVVDRIGSELPQQFSLKQNYPNPFNPTTTIEYTIPKTSKVELKLFDVTGREVGTLVNFNQNPGTYHVKLDASKLASGIYFYRLNAGAFSQTKKLSVVK